MVHLYSAFSHSSSFLTRTAAIVISTNIFPTYSQNLWVVTERMGEQKKARLVMQVTFHAAELLLIQFDSARLR